jgi:GT2 family glycosyltransferase
MTKINTFIVPHISWSYLRTTLESLRDNTPDNFKIILIDQSDTYSHRNDLIDIRVRSSQLGFARAANLGIRLADTKYVTVWNDDCEALNWQWWSGIEDTFEKFPDAVGVNPSSLRNPDGADGFEEKIKYKSSLTNEEYKEILAVNCKGYVLEAGCLFATVFDREKLDKIKGVIPGKCWFDERFFPGGGEDYDLYYRALSSGFRILGTDSSWVWHWWFGSGQHYGGDILEQKYGKSFDMYKVNAYQIPQNLIRGM